jgi:RNA-directed DNA polymerase
MKDEGPMKRDGIASDNGRKPAVALLRDELVANEAEKPESNHTALLARMLERGNLQRALKRVRQNQGAPGIDGMTVNELVDTDIEAFFDRVNHDRLVARLKDPIRGRALLRLIRAYLKAGVCIGEELQPTSVGVPQGGPLSPVLANVVLDELDWELDRRGHRFVRYADDCNIVLKSKRAGERLMASLTRWIGESLRLTVNARKSAVDRPWNRKFLGFTVSRNGLRLKVADPALEELKDRVREITRRTRGRRLGDIIAELREPLLGWKAYFGIAEVLSPLHDIDKWIRRRLRCYQWKQWGRAGYRELRRRGVSVRDAWHTSESAHGPWRLSKTPALALALPVRHFSTMGLPCLVGR